jgi:hypothetical protein
MSHELLCMLGWHTGDAGIAVLTLPSSVQTQVGIATMNQPSKVTSTSARTTGRHSAPAKQHQQTPPVSTTSKQHHAPQRSVLQASL